MKAAKNEMRIKYMLASPQKSVRSSESFVAAMYRVPDVVISRVCRQVESWSSPGVYFSPEVVFLCRSVVAVET